MTLTVSDLKAQLSQYPDDMPISITYLTGNEGINGAGVYQPLDCFLESFDIKVRHLTTAKGTINHLSLDLVGYLCDLFSTVQYANKGYS